MHRVLKQGGAVFALLIILAAPAALADDPPPATEPPQARIGPPIGVAAQAESPCLAARVWAWVMARIGPPIG